MHWLKLLLKSGSSCAVPWGISWFRISSFFRDFFRRWLRSFSLAKNCCSWMGCTIAHRACRFLGWGRWGRTFFFVFAFDQFYLKKCLKSGIQKIFLKLIFWNVYKIIRIHKILNFIQTSLFSYNSFVLFPLS